MAASKRQALSSTRTVQKRSTCVHAPWPGCPSRARSVARDARPGGGRATDGDGPLTPVARGSAALGAVGGGEGVRQLCDPCQQTVRPRGRTSGRSMLSADPSANPYSCRQRNPLSAADAQDTAKINLPVHSQTIYTGQACKTIVDSPAQMYSGRVTRTPARRDLVIQSKASALHWTPSLPCRPDRVRRRYAGGMHQTHGLRH